jgi:putative RNA 2'-phosphotransferase
MLIYILGHRPDEFGLVPDPDGFVTHKEILWAIHEEPGWSYVRQGHIKEVLMGKARPLFEIRDDRIRVLERHWRLELVKPAKDISKTLFTPVRRKAHLHVMEKGLRSLQGKPLVLSGDKQMAERIGRRRDQSPVLIEVMAAGASKEGVPFYAFGHLFLASEIPAEFIAGPPVAEDLIEAKDTAAKKPKAISGFEAGTFILDLDRDSHRREKGKMRKGWKEEARKTRRDKWR